MTEPQPRSLPGAAPDSVAIVVLNLDGRDHLPTCLEAVLASDGLSDPRQVVVADNGSTDDSIELVETLFPGVRTLRFDSNLGFAGGNNRAAQELSEEYVLFLNNDTSMAHDALGRLCTEVGGSVACAGARLVSWDGVRLDFDGGGATFCGHGHALGFGNRVPSSARTAEPTLFCSGAAMLVHRGTFLELGGFDPDYFFYYEDVDFGWRMRLAGYDALHVSEAVVRHRHHGTAYRLADSRASRLYERNALATVAKNYASDLLERTLPAALALAAHRAGADPAVIESAVPEPGSAWPVPGPVWPGWSALEHLELDFDDLGSRRRRVQALRGRTDSDVIELMRAPLTPVPPGPDEWQALRAAVEAFGLEQYFGPVGGQSATSGLSGAMSGMRRSFARGGVRHLADDLRRYVGWRQSGGGR